MVDPRAPGLSGGRISTVPPALRRAQILERIQRDGGVSVAELARDHAVSPITVHRDLEQLAREGLVERVHGAAHVDTRNAIENALPRLREMFASQGLSLADANVSREPPRQQSNQTPQSGSSSSGSFGADDGTSAVSAAQVRLGLLDTYA